MNLKEYLMTNSEPFLKDERNIFVLLWIERKGNTTALNIAKATNIPVKDVNVILQILFQNKLINIQGDGYSISDNGIGLLDKLGYSNMQIQNMLSQTMFSNTEYRLYNEILSTYRKEHLNIYSFMLLVYETEKGSWNKKSYLSEIEKQIVTQEEFLTLLIVNLVHTVGYILYSPETSNLISRYNELYLYCGDIHCNSSEKYYPLGNKKWKRLLSRDKLNAYFEKRLRNIYLKPMFHNWLNDDSQKIEWYISTDINKDLEISNRLFQQNNILLNALFECNNINELSKRMNLSNSQMEFILKALQSKISKLMEEEDFCKNK